MDNGLVIFSFFDFFREAVLFEIFESSEVVGISAVISLVQLCS